MAKRSGHMADLMTIGLFAPAVMASRLQMLATETVRPTAKGRRETARMIAEKPAAMMEGALAAQKKLFDSGLKLWSEQALAANVFLLSAPALSMAAAAAPVRRRVRRNSRRLTGF